MKSMNIRKMKKGPMILLAGSLTLASVFALPFSAVASPEGTRTAEEWATLRDDNLEWTEITDLILEYNATVKANQEKYTADKLSGKNAGQTADTLNSMAETYEAMATQAEGTAGGGIMAASYQVMADQLRSQADENVSDYRIILLENERIRMQVEESAKELFVEYHRAKLAKERNAKQVTYTQRKYNSAKNLQKYGMGTEVETLTALENFQKAQAEAITSDSNINTHYRKLITLCGWQYDANAKIGELPERDAETAAKIDRAADREKALANSLTLKEDAIKLENAKKLFGQTVVKKWESQQALDTNTVKSVYNSAADALALSKNSYDSALTQFQIQTANLATAANQLNLGTISKIDFAGVENSTDAAEAALLNAWMDLLLKRAAYDAVVNGLS